jgi:hypothetical protein
LTTPRSLLSLFLALRAQAWSKLLLAAQYLPAYEWLLWKDCDSFIANASVRVEDVVAAAAAARGVIASATADVLFGGGASDLPDASAGEAVAAAAAAGWAPSRASVPYGQPGAAGASHASTAHNTAPLPSSPSLDFIASEDGLMLNSGVFLLRNSGWARRLLQRAYGVVAATAADEEGRAAKVTADDASAVAGDDGSGGDHDVLPFYSRVEDGGSGSGSGAVPTATHVPPADPPAAGAAAAAAMRGAPLPMATNRAWEQASLFHLLALGGLPATTPGCGSGGDGASSSCCASARPAGATSASEPLPSLGGAHVAAPLAGALHGAACGAGALRPRAYADAARGQFVPQGWLNAYPPQLAGQIHDHHRRPMHAAWAPGDWVVSFSGCGMLLGSGGDGDGGDACEQLYAHYAALAQQPQQGAG